MSEAKGLYNLKTKKEEGERRKKECKSRRKDAHKQVSRREANSKKKERTTRSIYSSSQGCSCDKGNI